MERNMTAGELIAVSLTKRWLEDHGLLRVYPTLVEHGYHDDLETLKTYDKDEAEEFIKLVGGGLGAILMSINVEWLFWLCTLLVDCFVDCCVEPTHTWHCSEPKFSITCVVCEFIALAMVPRHGCKHDVGWFWFNRYGNQVDL